MELIELQYTFDGRPNYPRVIAHRCGGAQAPENTLAGLHVTAAAGVQGVEFDVMLSGDGVPMLIHDETVNRTSNGRGRVSRLTAADLQRLDAGSGFDGRFAGEPIPRFADAGRLCRALGLWANVEIKPAKGFEAVTGAAAAAMAKEIWRDAGHLPVLSSFSEPALAAARDTAPELPRAMLYTRVPRDWPARLKQLECRALHCAWRYLQPETVARATAMGIPVVCYTVNEAEIAQRLWSWGVTAVISDWPDRLA